MLLSRNQINKYNKIKNYNKNWINKNNNFKWKYKKIKTLKSYKFIQFNRKTQKSINGKIKYKYQKNN